MKDLKKFLITIPLYAIFTLAEAGLLKFGVYIVRTNWLPDLPPISYWTAMWVLIALGSLVSVWKAGNAIGDAITNA